MFKICMYTPPPFKYFILQQVSSPLNLYPYILYKYKQPIYDVESMYAYTSPFKFLLACFQVDRSTTK